jgi:hypothetical protein
VLSIVHRETFYDSGNLPELFVLSLSWKMIGTPYTAVFAIREFFATVVLL